MDAIVTLIGNNIRVEIPEISDELLRKVMWHIAQYHTDTDMLDLFAEMSLDKHTARDIFDEVEELKLEVNDCKSELRYEQEELASLESENLRLENENDTIFSQLEDLTEILKNIVASASR